MTLSRLQKVEIDHCFVLFLLSKKFIFIIRTRFGLEQQYGGRDVM